MQSSRQNKHSEKRVAVIDIGSSKVKIVAAAFQDKQRKATLLRKRELVNIASGLQATRPSITPDSLQRLEEVFREYGQTLQGLSVQSLRVIGTDALRRASNLEDIRQLVKDILGANLEILSQQEEATLFFSAVSAEIPGNISVIDVGGGSVQLTTGSNGVFQQAHLLRTGTVTLQRTFITSDFPSSIELEAMGQYVRECVQELHLSKSIDGRLVYGSTCILDFFQAARIGSANASRQSHPLSAQLNELKQLYNQIIKYSYDDRAKFFPADPYFMHAAELSLISAICVCEALGISEVIPTNLNISDALLLSLA